MNKVVFSKSKKVRLSIVLGTFILAALAALLVFGFLYKIKVFIVTSGSMETYIPQGSLILVSKTKSYKVGDIITYNFRNVPGNFITHRIIEIKSFGNKNLYYTKGDANNSSDKVPATENEIIGKLFFILPKGGFLLAFLLNPWVLSFLFYLPVGFVFGLNLQKLIIIKKDFGNWN